MKKYPFILALALGTISCNENASIHVEEISPAKTIDYEHIGDSLTTNAQAVLLSNVAGAIQNGGFAHAVDFCNLRATLLTDSLSSESFTISRISEKNRNPKNAASEMELNILQNFTTENNHTLVENDGKHIYYKAIRIGMPICLKCHGTPETLDTEASKMISDRYPNDKATGYKEGDLRGSWKVVFNY